MPAADPVDAIIRRRRGGGPRLIGLSGAPLVALLAAVSVPQGVAHASAVPGTGFSGDYSNAAGTRAYFGYLPSSYHAGTPLPLVVALHG